MFMKMENVNELLFNDNARSKLKEGIDLVCDAVKVTMGPQGRNVIINKINGSPHITKDGVTVAKEVFLKDCYRMMGANLIKGIASKTCDDVGDGTSTSTLFAQSIIHGGYKKVKINHKNPVEIKSGLEKACKIIQEFIAKNAIKVASDNEMMKHVATISANNDLFLGEIIATAVAKVGEFGAVTVDRSNNSDTILDVVNGFRIAKRGYLSPYFITNESKQECVMEDVIIYLTDQRLTKASDAINILNVAAKEKCAVLVIAEDVTEDALSTFVVNKIQNGMNVCCIKAPDFGQTRKDSLSDIAVLTGGKVFNVVDEGIFGFAKKVIIKKEDTLIIGATGEEDLIKEKASILKGISTQNLPEFEKKIIEERLSRFSNSVASLKVGAKTEIELLEKIDRIDDALCATRAAIEEGIVPGGGVVFLKARKELLKHKQMFKGDEIDGFDIIMDTLQAPIKQILINAGIDYEDIIPQIEENRKLFYGYNAKTYKYGNLLNQGVIDPAKVLRVALQNAVSISSLFLTTECAIAPQYD